MEIDGFGFFSGRNRLNQNSVIKFQGNVRIRKLVTLLKISDTFCIDFHKMVYSGVLTSFDTNSQCHVMLAL